MFHLARALLPALLPLVVLTSSADADVIIVDGAGGADFTNVQPALDAALDGDLILIRPGNYSNELLAGFGDRSLTIVGDVGGPVLLAPLNIFDIPAGSTVVVRNLSVVPGGAVVLLGGTASVRNSEGAVFFEDVNLPGQNGSPGLQGIVASDGLPGLSLFNASAVTFQRCTVTGGLGTDTTNQSFPAGQMVTSDGGVAARVAFSDVAFYDCVLAGGRGGNDAFGLIAKGGDGGRGLDAESSRVILSGCSITGGDGGNGCSVAQASEGCRGADAFGQSAVGSALQELDTTFNAGVGGDLDGGGTAADGVDLDVTTGFHFPFSGSSVGLTIAGPLRTAETGTVTVTGPAGGVFAIFFGFEMNYLPLFHFKGVFLPGFPIEGPIVLDVMPPGGSFSFNYSAPVIAPFGLQSLVTFDQVLMDQGADGVIAGATSTHVQVDTGF